MLSHHDHPPAVRQPIPTQPQDLCDKVDPSGLSVLMSVVLPANPLGRTGKHQLELIEILVGQNPASITGNHSMGHPSNSRAIESRTMEFALCAPSAPHRDRDRPVSGESMSQQNSVRKCGSARGLDSGPTWT